MNPIKFYVLSTCTKRSISLAFAHIRFQLGNCANKKKLQRRIFLHPPHGMARCPSAQKGRENFAE